MARSLLKFITFLSIAIGTTSAYSNVVWPALFIAGGIFNSLPLVVISIAIEALFFYAVIEHISVLKSLFMSLVGNSISTLVGVILMPFTMILWHLSVDQVLGGAFHPLNIKITLVLMYLGSSLIELVSIKIFFKYSTQELLNPVLAGNFVTYALVAFFRFHRELKMLFG